MIKKLQSQKGFTLVEILIVVALIAILAVIALITINPAEAQKRSRDAQRLKEIGVIQGVVEQYITDNIQSVTTISAVSSSGSKACGTAGWLGIDLCNYANTMPVDPVNRAGEYARTDGTTTTGNLFYQVLMDDNLRYRVCTRLESAANSLKLASDGVSDDYFEVYSSTDAPACSL